MFISKAFILLISIFTFQAFAQNLVGSTFVFIPKGEFMMGSTVSKKLANQDDETHHEVVLTESFYIMTHEVTQKQWFSIMEENPSYFRTIEYCPGNHLVIDETPMCPNLPVENINFKDVSKFIKKLNKENKHNDFIYMLPTEAQWEYAARSGSKTNYHFGNKSKNLSEYAWFEKNSNDQTHEVGKLKPNRWGLYDMHGNVSEWTRSWFYKYNKVQTTNPKGPKKGQLRSIRGGSFSFDSLDQRSSSRLYVPAKMRNNQFGIRVIIMNKNKEI